MFDFPTHSWYIKFHVTYINKGQSTLQILCKCKFWFGIDLLYQHPYIFLLLDQIIPRVCPKCFKVFKNKMTLAKHLRLQCGTEAKYVCSYCGKKFKRNDNMKRHIQHVHKRRIQYVPFVNKFLSLDYWIRSFHTNVEVSHLFRLP